MLALKVASALATGCTAVVKPAEQTPTSVIMLMELIGDILPAGVLNIVTGFGAEAGQALATSKRKLNFHSLVLRKQVKVYHNAAENIIPVTMELGGKSPNIPSVAAQDDKFFSKAVEGVNVCTKSRRNLYNSITYFST
jgi:aldehyde dehydrogenase (NAD+)/aldehyde dehydrogenase